MTTHLTHDDPVEEEPELVLIDDDEYEAAHRDDYADEADELSAADSAGEDEFEFSFEDDLDEAIALDMSDEMDPTVEDADDRMAALFSAQHVSDDDAGGDDAAGAGAVVAGALGALGATAAVAEPGVVVAPAQSKRDSKAEEKRQRDILKRRKEMDKAASLDEKERQRDEKAHAIAAEREAAVAQKEAAEAAKRDAAEAKRMAAEAKKQEAEDAKRAATEAKIRQSEEKAAAKAEAKRAKADAKRQATRGKDPVPAGLTSFVVDEQRAPEPESAGARSRKDARVEKQEDTKRTLLVVVVVVLLVVVGVAAYAMTRPKASTGAGAGAGANGAGGAGTGVSALPAAVASTVSANTADVAYALDIGGSQPASINGGGSVDLATQGSNLSLTYSLGGQSFPEQIVYDGGQGFYDLGAIVHYVAPGYDWVSMDLAPGGSGVPGIGVGGVLADPSALVSLLAASASSARDVGRVQVDGAPATEYSIALNQAALTQVIASAGVPSFVRTASYTQLNEQAYVDSTGRVSRIVAVGTYADSGQTITASTTLDLSHYGTPVSVAPPPPPQVVPEQQFEASAARLAHAPTP